MTPRGRGHLYNTTWYNLTPENAAHIWKQAMGEQTSGASPAFIYCSTGYNGQLATPSFATLQSHVSPEWMETGELWSPWLP